MATRRTIKYKNHNDNILLNKKYPDCRIPMRIVNETEYVTNFRCPNCGKEKKKLNLPLLSLLDYKKLSKRATT